ncbi:MAG: efflux RND transporter periplasmic adaptor subunit [Candidatus Rokubacteria bacterium]|nr:efflux RND transporter periplasmic adaptor subunit [Candidatus Rokubacteria bacterium]
MRRYRVGLALLGLAIILGVLVASRLKDQQARAVQHPRDDALVGVITPARRDLEVKLASTADILPAQQAAIFSKVSGYIRRIHADRGDLVRAGQLLVEIDDQELQAQVEQARAGLLSGQAGLQMARSTLEGHRASLENQRANLSRARAVAANDARQAERMKTLFERGLVSATDWDNARTLAESSRASVQSADAQLLVAETQIATSESQVRLAMAQVETYRATLRLAETNLSNTRLVAPFTGFVSQRNLDPGATVSAQSSGTNTSSLGILVLQDIASVRVQVEVPERQIARVTPGLAVRLGVDPYRGEVFTGRVARIVQNLDPRSRTMGIEVDIPNPDGRLKPGMFARVDLVVDRRAAALVIPVEALRLGEGKPSVMAVRGGAAQSVAVEVGLADGGWLEVVSGLAEADQVIVQGKDLVKPGQTVRAVPATGG